MGFFTFSAKTAAPRRFFIPPLNGVTFESMAYMKHAGDETCENAEGEAMIGRLVKFLVVVVLLGVIGLVGFAYIGDLAPEPAEQSLTVTLDAE